MRRKTRKKINKVLIVISLIFIIIILGVIIAILIKLSKTPPVSYDDNLVGKNYFKEISIDLSKNEIKRDDKTTTLQEEFDISDERASLVLNSKEELMNFLSESSFVITEENNVIKLTNPYQTKCFIVEANEIEEKVDGEEINEIQDDLYILSFYSEKLTKAMYNYYKDKQYIKNIFYDEVFINTTINDISQTMYGQTQVDLANYKSLGVTSMGLNNYQKIINENGNQKEVVISTIGYGINTQNEIFKDRLTDNYYNFIADNKQIPETIEQGSRIAEVLVDSTTSNVKLMPLVVIDEEGYTSISSIIKAIAYSVQNADVTCFELVCEEKKAIDLSLEKAFKENLPVCVVSTIEENYPANHGMTIAVSSLDRELNTTDYSARGEFIDFAASSTDVAEIFNPNSTVSRWSGPRIFKCSNCCIYCINKNLQ